MLAIVTAVVDAGGANRVLSAQATLGAYRPALAVIILVSALGATTALTALRPARRRRAAAAELVAVIPEQAARAPAGVACED